MEEQALPGRAVAAARTSVVLASALAGAKLLAVVLTGSIALAASFFDSLTDVFASTVNLVAVRIGSRAADAEHRYGHGKAEGLAGMFQGAVIGFSGLYLVVESGRRLIVGSRVEHEDWGVAVMAVSLVASLWISRYLRRAAAQTGSVALAADRVHYASDVWMNSAVLCALIAVRTTGLAWIDPVAGLVVAGVVLRSSAGVIKSSLDELMDRELPEDVVATVRAAVAAAVPEVREMHDLRTRRAGPRRFVDVHVSLDRTLSFPDAHRLSERVAKAISDALPGAQVQVHADPYPLRPDDLG
jgi:ferrous-iron efflux pump FieF